MASITKEELRKEINEILKDADLTTMSSKKVRLQIEKKLKCNLLDRKKEVDDMVMEFVSEANGAEGDEDEEENGSASDGGSSDEESSKTKKAPKRSAEKPPIKKAAPAKKKKNDSDDDGGDSDAASNGKASSDDSDDEPPKRRAASKQQRKSKGRKKTDSDSDADWKKPKAAKKAGGGGKGNGFTRPITLSPELATLMGEESMPRHAVVKKMWEIIKERNLYDPKNKQFAICDKDLLPVMGVKRFRTFGMLKYLKTHFRD